MFPTPGAATPRRGVCGSNTGWGAGERVLLPRTEKRLIYPFGYFISPFFGGLFLGVLVAVAVTGPALGTGPVAQFNRRWPRVCGLQCPSGAVSRGEPSRVPRAGPGRRAGTSPREHRAPHRGCHQNAPKNRKKKVPVYETFRETPSISQPREGQRAPAGRGGQAWLGFPAGNEIRSKKNPEN